MGKDERSAFHLTVAEVKQMASAQSRLHLCEWQRGAYGDVLGEPWTGSWGGPQEDLSILPERGVKTFFKNQEKPLKTCNWGGNSQHFLLIFF